LLFLPVQLFAVVPKLISSEVFEMLTSMGFLLAKTQSIEVTEG